MIVLSGYVELWLEAKDALYRFTDVTQGKRYDHKTGVCPCGITSLFVVKDLYTFRVLADIRHKGLLDFIASAAGYAEDKVVQGGTTKNIDMVTWSSV